jgi:hypothetical protein
MRLDRPFPCPRVPVASTAITPARKNSRLFTGVALALATAISLVAANATVACAQAVTFDGSGAVNFGSANVCLSGKPTPCSKVLTLTYNVTASGTLGTPQVLTTGAPNLDFTLAGGSTCTGSVTQGDTCTVNVVFAPTTPGSRNGAVEIVDGSGNVLATTYVDGNGVGPLIGFSPSSQRIIGSGSINPLNLAVDAKGDVFVTGLYMLGYSDVQELLAVNGIIPENPTIEVLKSGSVQAALCVAVDGAGNVFVGFYDGTVREILAQGGYSTVRTLSSGFSYIAGIAVDANANLFIADENLHSVTEIVAAGGYATTQILGGGFAFSFPEGITVDGSGNIFVADTGAADGGFVGTVFELPAAGGYKSVKTIHVSNSDRALPAGVAVDPAGNLFVSFVYPYSVEEALAIDGVVPSNPTFLLFGNLTNLNAIDFDSRGDLYVTLGTGGLGELQSSAPPSLNYANTVVGQTSSDSPQSIQVQNQGNANLDATALSVSTNWNLVPGSGTFEDCSANFSLAPAALCNLSIDFAPTQPGALTGALTVVDDSLNAPGSTQSSQLSGTGLRYPAPVISGLNTSYGAPYSVVILTGTNFGPTKGSSTVTFNGLAAAIYSWSDTKILVTMPDDHMNFSDLGNLLVTVNGEVSNAVSFALLPMPSITGIQPVGGHPGDVVTIVGDSLVDYEDRGTVTFNGKSLPILSQSSDSIQVTVPTGAVTGEFHVLVNDTGMNSPTFTILPVDPPVVTGISTSYGAPYSVVTLTGNNFGTSQELINVTFFNGAVAPLYVWSDTRLVVTVPGNALTGNIVVTVGGRGSNALPPFFTVLPLPVVTGISPSSGSVGTLVTISGKNLVDYENKGTVTLNGESLPILSETSTAIQVAVPAGAVTGEFHVLVNNTGMNTSTFTVTK